MTGDPARSTGRGPVLLLTSCLLLAGCEAEDPPGTAVITFPGSALGAEARLLETQLQRFMERNPDVRVEQRQTPDAADQRHQLYVQWLNAGASDPDILQLDVIWTSEFAAAGWILPLDRFDPRREGLFSATVEANSWRDSLYALPWWVDVGMLYWRTDLMDSPPETFRELASAAARVKEEEGLPYGFVWQGARYEGLVTGFLEYLGGFGGRFFDRQGRVVLDSDAGVRALTFMRDAIGQLQISPRSVLTWQEEQTRFAFQNGGAAFMRNWPYAYPLMEDSADSRVAGKFEVAPMPAAPGGRRTAALGGSQLAINRNTEHPDAAWRLLEFLTRPEQMLERARVAGQYPPLEELYEADGPLEDVLPGDPERLRDIVSRARPRPVIPVYTQLSEMLQIRLHRALTGQTSPEAAVSDAAREIRRLLERVELRPAGSSAAGTSERRDGARRVTGHRAAAPGREGGG